MSIRLVTSWSPYLSFKLPCIIFLFVVCIILSRHPLSSFCLFLSSLLVCVYSVLYTVFTYMSYFSVQHFVYSFLFVRLRKYFYFSLFIFCRVFFSFSCLPLFLSSSFCFCFPNLFVVNRTRFLNRMHFHMFLLTAVYFKASRIVRATRTFARYILRHIYFRFVC